MKTKERVLQWCNRVRRKFGKKPVARIRCGDVGEIYSCPLANTIGNCAVADELWVETKEGEEMLYYPRYIERFIEDFDAGEYPELVK